MSRHRSWQVLALTLWGAHFFVLTCCWKTPPQETLCSGWNKANVLLPRLSSWFLLFQLTQIQSQLHLFCSYSKPTDCTNSSTGYTVRSWAMWPIHLFWLTLVPGWSLLTSFYPGWIFPLLLQSQKSLTSRPSSPANQGSTEWRPSGDVSQSQTCCCTAEPANHQSANIS